MEKADNTMLHPVPAHLVMRASAASIAIVEIILLVPVVLAVSLLVRDPRNVEYWKAFAAGISPALFMFIWFRSFLITLKDNVLYCRSLFGGKKKIRIEDIKKWHIQSGSIAENNRSLLVHRLVVVPNSNSPKDIITINLRVFKIDEIEHLLSSLPSDHGKPM